MKRQRTRTNDPVGLRNHLLDVAARAFQSNGYGATSTHDLVREAGVTGGALHHHFPTKRHIALAVIAERVSAEIGDTWVATVHDAPTTAVGILRAFDSVIYALEERGCVSGCPLGNLAHELALADEGLRGALAGEYQKWCGALIEHLDRDLAQGLALFARPDPRAFASVVVAMVSGAMGICKTEQNTSALRACREQLRSLMAADLPD